MGIAPSLDLVDSQWSMNGSQFLSEMLMGSSAFFQLTVSVDDKNSSVNVLTVCMSPLLPVLSCVYIVLPSILHFVLLSIVPILSMCIHALVLSCFIDFYLL